MREVEFSDANVAAFSNLHCKRVAQAMRLEHFSGKPPHGPFDVSVPQTVDEGVQHGGDHSVHH